MRDRSVADDLSDLAAWIEGSKRILKDHLDTAALGAQRLALQRRQIDVADPDGAAGSLGQPHHQTRDRKLAGAGLADQAERPAFEGREIDLGRGGPFTIRRQPTPRSDL